MKLLRWRSDTVVKSLLFCRVATIVFSSCCLVILITFFLCANFKWQLLSDGSDIAMIEIISNLLRQLVLILGTNIFASDGQRWRALSLWWGSDVESDIANPSHRCRTRSINPPLGLWLSLWYLQTFLINLGYNYCIIKITIAGWINISYM